VAVVEQILLRLAEAEQIHQEREDESHLLAAREADGNHRVVADESHLAVVEAVQSHPLVAEVEGQIHREAQSHLFPEEGRTAHWGAGEVESLTLFFPFNSSKMMER
jgi:hypothetical protein